MEGNETVFDPRRVGEVDTGAGASPPVAETEEWISPSLPVDASVQNANDKPTINHTEEEKNTYGMRCGLSRDDPKIPDPECRRVGHNLIDVIAKMVKEMLAAGIIDQVGQW